MKRTSDGRSFLIGSPCSTLPVIEQQCTEIPPGLTALRELLRKLDQQQLGHPLCDCCDNANLSDFRRNVVGFRHSLIDSRSSLVGFRSSLVDFRRSSVDLR